jgi:hypothetical protein
MSNYQEEKRINDYNQETEDKPLPRHKYKWVTLALVITAAILGFAVGKPEEGQTNVFDYLAAVFSVGAFISVFFFIPRKTRPVSFIVTGLMSLLTVLALIIV